jgi:hypothetical protein
MGPAPPGNLVLWDVVFGPDIRWENIEGCREQFFKAIRPRYVEAKSRSSILEAIHAKLREEMEK